MKIDNTLVYIFIPPLIAVILCVLSPHLIATKKNFVMDQPEFLNYVDKLSVITLKDDTNPALYDIKDVFRHEWILPIGDILGGEAVHEPVKVSMIVAAGLESYCIIDGRKMGLGARTDRYQITSIGQQDVTITYKNGTRETHHVKVY